MRTPTGLERLRVVWTIEKFLLPAGRISLRRIHPWAAWRDPRWQSRHRLGTGNRKARSLHRILYGRLKETSAAVARSD